VEHTTVARRVQALEKRWAKACSPGGRRSPADRSRPAVAAGHRSHDPGGPPTGHAAELAVDDAEAPSGLVRVGTTEGLGTQLLAPALARLTLQWPQLSVDLLALPRLLHLSRREADIVISLERPKRGTVVVSKLADYRLYLYGEREYLARRPLVAQREDLRHHRFIHYVDDLLFSKELQLLDQLYRPERFAFRSTSITAQYEAVRAGAGLAVLPAFLADRDPT
jgi:DNA-binding transcriptional LysR family regulator